MFKFWAFFCFFMLIKQQKNTVYGGALLLKSAYNCPGAPNPMPIRMDVKILKNFSNYTQLLDFTLTVPFAMHTNTLKNLNFRHFKANQPIWFISEVFNGGYFWGLGIMFDEDTATAKIERNTLGNVWVPLVKIEDKKGMCNLFTINGKDMWADAEKLIGLTANKCPIPAGNYHTDHLLLYLTKERSFIVLPGTYRATLEIFEKANNRVLLCKVFDVENTV